MKLTQKAVSAMLPGERRIVWDDAVPGFGVMITKGACSYIVNFRIGKQQRRSVVGPTSIMKLEQARDRAAEIVLGARKGLDLTGNHREDKPTFRSVWTRLLEEVDRPRLSPATITDYEDRADRLILPRIGDKAIADVSEADVDRI